MQTLDESLDGPKFVQLFEPVLLALRKLGGSARPAEVVEQIADDMNLPEEDLAETLDSGALRFRNLVAWARFYLVKAGYIDASRRGVWALTEKGLATTSLDHGSALAVFKAEHSKFPSSQGDHSKAEPVEEEISAPTEDGGLTVADYRQLALATLLGLPPAGFERFCQRLLRESGFQEVSVTGRSGDGGIDGIGILEVNPLVSFKVLFQCKRYKGSVVPSQVRDFRGAMSGRADKGIIITTGAFTTDARKEAVRDGAPPIELVDGEKLVDMLENLELGLIPVKAYRVNEAFFDEFK
jgi:restriction system protein